MIELQQQKKSNCFLILILTADPVKVSAGKRKKIWFKSLFIKRKKEKDQNAKRQGRNCWFLHSTKMASFDRIHRKCPEKLIFDFDFTVRLPVAWSRPRITPVFKSMLAMLMPMENWLDLTLRMRSVDLFAPSVRLMIHWTVCLPRTDIWKSKISMDWIYKLFIHFYKVPGLMFANCGNWKEPVAFFWL